MRADMDDAPEHLRQSKTHDGPWRMLAILGTGSAITWTLIALFAKPIVIDVTQLRQGIRFADQPILDQPEEPFGESSPPNLQPLPQRTVREPTPALSQAEIEWFDQNSEKTVERIQKSFNDKNYKPRTDINTMSPPPSQYFASQNREQKRQTIRQVNRTRWHWENGYKKRLVSGSFEWVVVNDNIDYSSVCQNYQRGSLIYRDCRKGAKVAFTKMCSEYKPACHAANNYMP